MHGKQTPQPEPSLLQVWMPVPPAGQKQGSEVVGSHIGPPVSSLSSSSWGGKQPNSTANMLKARMCLRIQSSGIGTDKKPQGPGASYTNHLGVHHATAGYLVRRSCWEDRVNEFLIMMRARYQLPR